VGKVSHLQRGGIRTWVRRGGGLPPHRGQDKENGAGGGCVSSIMLGGQDERIGTSKNDGIQGRNKRKKGE